MCASRCVDADEIPFCFCFSFVVCLIIQTEITKAETLCELCVDCELL